MNLRQLEYFLAISQLGSFTAASQKLGVAQPTLTRSIHALEQETGARLFDRLPRGVLLTPQGTALQKHAQRVNIQLQDAVAEVASLSNEAPGVVVIGAGPSWLRRMLPDAVATVLKRAPGVKVSVVGGFDDVLLKALRAGELDLVVAELPPNESASGLELQKLTSDRLGVFARINHPLAGKKSVSLSDLLAYQWVMSPKTTRPQQRLDAIFAAASLPAPTIVAETDSVAFLLRLVAATDALTFTVESTTEMLESQGTTMLAVPELAKVARSAGIIVRKGGWLRPAAAMTIEELKALARSELRN